MHMRDLNLIPNRCKRKCFPKLFWLCLYWYGPIRRVKMLKDPARVDRGLEVRKLMVGRLFLSSNREEREKRSGDRRLQIH